VVAQLGAEVLQQQQQRRRRPERAQPLRAQVQAGRQQRAQPSRREGLSAGASLAAIRQQQLQGISQQRQQELLLRKQQGLPSLGALRIMLVS
jgi:hypothetical protein